MAFPIYLRVTVDPFHHDIDMIELKNSIDLGIPLLVYMYSLTNSIR